MTESESPSKGSASTAEASAPEAVAPPIEEGGQTALEESGETPAPSSGVFWGTGRRKCAVARVRLTPGEGKVLINKRQVDEYFHEPEERLAVRESLIATNTEGSFSVLVNVHGGGHKGQAQAIRLGLARALVRAAARHEAPLREKGYLTRDARIVERKKYGQRKARRRFQFSKR